MKSKKSLPNGDPIIAVLVFSCNRITVQRCLDQLINLRPSAVQFPIVVSQDCEHEQTAEVISKYGDKILHIRVLLYNFYYSLIQKFYYKDILLTCDLF